MANSLAKSSTVTATGASKANRPARATHPGAAKSAAYRLGIGDVIQINIWKEPDLSLRAVTVRSDGKIALPIVKEVQAAGLTPAELEKVLTDRFSKFINAPEVAVVVREIRSERVYLVGAVKNEGVLFLKSPMTVLQALAEAGGLSDYAKKTKIYILRTENQKQVRLPFDYQAVIRGERLEQNVMVRSGDTIVVPQ